MSLRRPYRLGIYGWFERAFGLLLAGFGASVVLALLFGEPTTSGSQVPAAILTVAFLVGMAVFDWPMARTGVFVDDDGVVTKVFLRTERYAWDDIAHVDVVPLTETGLALYPRAAAHECVRLRLTDGSQRVLGVINSSVGTWLGTKPEGIAAAVNAARPSRASSE